MELKDVKKAMAERKKVKYRGVHYYVTACILRIQNKQWYYQLELHDLQANAVVIAPIDKVEEAT